ncbi:MAG: DMT family transporter [Lachnospiraceae bacterium]|nr:DMT family transporter [Lachnospiraceae bacterium]
MNKTKNVIMLLIAAIIWGSAFVAQSVGMDYIGPFSFNGIRQLIGAVVLLPVIFVFDRIDPERVKAKAEHRYKKKDLIIASICCGLFLSVATNAQQIGMIGASTGKAGFITTLYIIIVPLINLLFGKKVSAKVWGGVVIALVGFYLLSMTAGDFSISKWDVCLLICAVFFSGQIVCISHFAPLVDGIRLSCYQFVISGVISCIIMAVREKPDLHSVLMAIWPLLYAGVLSCGVAYTFQILGQKDFNPTIASLIMSLESVISALSGWIILGQSLSHRELSGCVLIFAAVILAQLPERVKEKKSLPLEGKVSAKLTDEVKTKYL